MTVTAAASVTVTVKVTVTVPSPPGRGRGCRRPRPVGPGFDSVRGEPLRVSRVNDPEPSQKLTDSESVINLL